MRKFLALAVCFLFCAGSVNAEMVVPMMTPEPVVGDYIVWVGDDIATEIMGDDPESDIHKYLSHKVDKPMEVRMEVVSTGEMTVQGEKREYYNVEYSLGWGLTVFYDNLNDDEDDREDFVTFSFDLVMGERLFFDSEGKETTVVGGWQDKTTGTLSRSTVMYTPEEGDSETWKDGVFRKTYIDIDITESETIEEIGSRPEEIRVGDNWTVWTKEMFTDSYNYTALGIDGQLLWAEDGKDSAATEAINNVTCEVLSEVEAEVPAGKFDTVKVSCVDVPDGESLMWGVSEGNETYSYYDGETGVQVRTVEMADGEVSLDLKLKEGKWGAFCWGAGCNEDVEERLPSLSFMISMASVALIAMVRRTKTV